MQPLKKQANKQPKMLNQKFLNFTFLTVVVLASLTQQGKREKKSIKQSKYRINERISYFDLFMCSFSFHLAFALKCWSCNSVGTGGAYFCGDPFGP